MKRLLVLLGCIALLAACSSSSKNGSASTTTTPTSVDMRGHTTVDIDAQNNLFSPATIVVSVGTKVTWHNRDSVTHNVKPATDTENFGAPFGVDLGAFGPGGSYSFTFATAGTFSYTCTVHTGMNGIVVVVAGTTTNTT